MFLKINKIDFNVLVSNECSSADEYQRIALLDASTYVAGSYWPHLEEHKYIFIRAVSCKVEKTCSTHVYRWDGHLLTTAHIAWPVSSSEHALPSIDAMPAS